MTKSAFYRPQRSCGQGYVFTCVCDSVHRGVSGEPPPGPGRHPPRPGRLPPRTKENPPSRENPPPGPRRTPPDQADTPPGRRLQHTVNERPVRILLECILVTYGSTPEVSGCKHVFCSVFTDSLHVVTPFSGELCGCLSTLHTWKFRNIRFNDLCLASFHQFCKYSPSFTQARNWPV